MTLSLTPANSCSHRTCRLVACKEVHLPVVSSLNSEGSSSTSWSLVHRLHLEWDCSIYLWLVVRRNTFECRCGNSFSKISSYVLLCMCPLPSEKVTMDWQTIFKPSWTPRSSLHGFFFPRVSRDPTYQVCLCMAEISDMGRGRWIDVELFLVDEYLSYNEDSRQLNSNQDVVWLMTCKGWVVLQDFWTLSFCWSIQASHGLNLHWPLLHLPVHSDRSGRKCN